MPGARRNPGADSICCDRARSDGSRTTLAVSLQFRKMLCQNERKKLARIRYQVTCCNIKFESGDISRLLMIDEIDHVSKNQKSSETVRVRADAVVFCEGVFLRSFLGLELRMRMLKRHECCHFPFGVGVWAPALPMATALQKSTHSVRESTGTVLIPGPRVHKNKSRQLSIVLLHCQQCNDTHANDYLLFCPGTWHRSFSACNTF